MVRAAFLILCLIGQPAAAELAEDEQRKLDAAAELAPDSREAALQRFLLLREAEGIVEEMLAAGPPVLKDAPLVTPEAMAERAALREAAGKDFAPFCEGREPRACLLAEAEALLPKAPEVDREAERWGAIGPSEAERGIALLLVKAGHFEDAARIAAGIADPIHQARAIQDVVLVHLWTGDGSAATRLRDVEDVIAKINRNPAIITELVTKIADWLAQQGDPEGVLEFLPKAEQFAAFIRSEEWKGKVLVFIATEYMDIGEFDRARALINEIEDDYWRASGAEVLAFFLAEAGEFVGAEEVTAEIYDARVDIRDDIYLHLAESLASADQPDEARRVVARISDGARQVRALAKVAVVLAKVDSVTTDTLFAEAKALARGIEDANSRVNALGEIAEALVRAGNAPAAEEIATELSGTQAGPSWIFGALEDVAEALQGVGQRDASVSYALRAEGLALRIEDMEGRSGRLQNVARLLIEAAAYAEAERVSAKIEDATDRVFALTDWGVAVARSGEGRPDARAEVLRIAAVIGGIDGAERWRGSGLMQIVQALAVAGDVAGAEAVADGIVEPVRRSEALAESTVALAEGRRLVEALRIAGRVEDGAWRAVALGAVAAGL